LFAFLLLFARASDAADNKREAKRLFEAATAHYAVGKFAEAADEYQRAYELKPDPALLYNAAQAYRLANMPERAMLLYRNYLNLYPNEGNAEEVRAQIAKLKEAIAAAEKAKNNPPTETVAPKPMADEKPAPTPTPVVETTPAPPPSTTPDRPAPTPVYKKWWLWTIVGVVVAGGVVGGVLAATLPSGTWNNAPDVGPGSAAGLTVRF
jgi:tetratricopeptide (TPR) repeat protein